MLLTLNQEQSDDVEPCDPAVPEVELGGPEVPEAEPDQEEREAAAEEEFYWATMEAELVAV
eukprot:6075866-Heterocapsa_arctica.AAC.1